MNKQTGVVAIVLGVLTATIPAFLLFQAVTYLFIVPLILGILCIGLGIAAIRSEGRILRHAGSVAALVMFISVVLPIGMMAYRDRSGCPVVMMIPEGYRGPIKLVIDRKRGIAVPLRNGMFTYNIPRDGTLLIKDDIPFRQWHSMIAKYSSGKPIPTDYERSLPPDAVSLHSLGSGVETQEGKEKHFIEDFVGTQAELMQYLRRR